MSGRSVPDRSPSADEFERVIRGGGVVLFPADTVYGLACSPDDAAAVARLYAIKGRPPEKASAVMYFSLDVALRGFSSLGERTRAALGRLMPGGVTVLLPGGHGLRVVDVPALRGVAIGVLQSSANESGSSDARTVAEVPSSIRAAVDLVVDGGELPGVASTVVDLRDYEDLGSWSIVRVGAVSASAVAAALDCLPSKWPASSKPAGATGTAAPSPDSQAP